MSKFQDDILKFNKMYGLPCPLYPTSSYLKVDVETQLRRFHKMLTDELAEIETILSTKYSCEEEQLTEIADWLGDIQVYAASEMRKFGLDNDVVLDIIMQSNFSKLGADGKPIVVDGKVQKGPNYWKPEPKLLEAIKHGRVPVGTTTGRVSGRVENSGNTPKHGDIVRHGDEFNNDDMAYCALCGQAHTVAYKACDGLRGPWPRVPTPAPVVEPSTPPKSYAHATQVGGTHYAQGDKPQHWDLSIMYRWDPFQYQITKYVMRWKDKHPTAEKKLEDLKKARSFLDKYIDNYREFLPAKEETPIEHEKNHERLATIGEEDAKKFFTCEGYYGDGSNLYKCNACKHTLKARSFLDAMQFHDCEIDSQAGRAYVNQG